MVICSICGHQGDVSLQVHLKNRHNLSIPEYRGKYPGSTVYDPDYEARHRESVLNRDPSYKEKLSVLGKNRWKDQGYRERQTAVLKKAQNSDVAKENHSKGALNYFENRTEEQRSVTVTNIKKSWKDPDKRENRINAITKAHNRPEVVDRHSKATKKIYECMTPEERLEKRSVLKKVWSIPENRVKLMELSKIGLEAAKSPEAQEKLRAAARTPEARMRKRANMIKILKSMPTKSSLNVMFEKALKDRGLNPESEYPIEFYLVDFCFPDKKVVVEVDGDYWHGNPKLYTALNKLQSKVSHKDKREKTYLENRGWKLFRFWEQDIKKDLDSCIAVIQESVA